MKILLAVFASALLVSPRAMAQSQVIYSASPGQRSVYSIGGAPVADGNAVWIGAFNSTFNVTANASRPDLLLANWHSFGSTSISTIALQQGRFSGNSSNPDPFFGNQKIYLWIFSTDGATAPNVTDFNNVNEYGIFSASGWSFSPDPNPPGNLKTINSNQIDQNPFGTYDPTHLFLSTFSPVPEPSTVALLSIGIPAALLAFRRRR